MTAQSLSYESTYSSQWVLSSFQRLTSQMMDLGNIAVGSLLFGQAFHEFEFDFRVAALGIIVLLST